MSAQIGAGIPGSRSNKSLALQVAGKIAAKIGAVPAERRPRISVSKVCDKFSLNDDAMREFEAAMLLKGFTIETQLRMSESTVPNVPESTVQGEGSDTAPAAVAARVVASIRKQPSESKLRRVSLDKTRAEMGWTDEDTSVFRALLESVGFSTLTFLRAPVRLSAVSSLSKRVIQALDELDRLEMGKPQVSPHGGSLRSLRPQETAAEFVRRVPPSKYHGDNVFWIYAFNPNTEENVVRAESSSLASGGAVAASRGEAVDILAALWDSVPDADKADVHRLYSACADPSLGRFLRSGKWLLYVKPEQIDQVWTKVVDSLIAGRLGTTAKVSPLGKKPSKSEAQGTNRLPIICVYTRDFCDIDDVNRVLQELRNLGVDQHLSYKADAVTYLGIYSSNPWGVTPCFYTAPRESREAKRTQPFARQKSKAARKRLKRRRDKVDKKTDDEEHVRGPAPPRRRRRLARGGLRDDATTVTFLSDVTDTTRNTGLTNGSALTQATPSSSSVIATWNVANCEKPRVAPAFWTGQNSVKSVAVQLTGESTGHDPPLFICLQEAPRALLNELCGAGPGGRYKVAASTTSHAPGFVSVLLRRGVEMVSAIAVVAGCVLVVVSISGRRIAVASVHLPPGSKNATARRAALERVAAAVPTGLPAVIAGDFNMRMSEGFWLEQRGWADTYKVLTAAKQNIKSESKKGVIRFTWDSRENWFHGQPATAAQIGLPRRSPGFTCRFDRVYTRGFSALRMDSLGKEPICGVAHCYLSDHYGLSATLALAAAVDKAQGARS